MTADIPKSQTWPDFELDVANFAEAMRSWRDHMGRVSLDASNGVTGLERHVAYPRPVAPALVDAAVDEDGNADYRIVDDTPSPEETLPLRKQQLLDQVSMAELTAIEKVAPRAKQRWLMFQEQEIRGRDLAIVKGIVAKETGMLNAVKKAAGFKSKSSDEIAKAVNDARSGDDQELLARVKAQRAKIEAIQRIGAKAHAEIADLTVDTIDKWKMPEFPAA